TRSAPPAPVRLFLAPAPPVPARSWRWSANQERSNTEGSTRRITSPPRPPSPPSGPPLGVYGSLRSEALPAPPSPARTRPLTRSTNMASIIGGGHDTLVHHGRSHHRMDGARPNRPGRGEGDHRPGGPGIGVPPHRWAIR